MLAEGVGIAPTSARADPVFKTGAASLYLPAFLKWSEWRELHSRPPRSKRGRLLLTLHPDKMALAGGISPSSSMLEASRSMN